MDDETANTAVSVSSGLSYAGGRPSPVTVTAALGPEPELLPVKKETPTYTARPVSTRTRQVEFIRFQLLTCAFVGCGGVRTFDSLQKRQSNCIYADITVLY